MSEKKKLIFCTYSSIYSSRVLKQLLADKDIEILAIINSTRVLSPQYGHLRGSIEQIRIIWFALLKLSISCYRSFSRDPAANTII